MSTNDRNARTAGALYLLSGVVGVLDLIYLPGLFVVRGDAAATANNIATHEALFRVAAAADIVAGTVWLAVVLALYRLFESVDRTQVNLMLILGALLQVPFYFFNAVNYIAALTLVHGAPYLTVFTAPQRDAMALLFLTLHHYVIEASLVFAGLWLFPLAILIYKSDFLPKLLAFWITAAGISWLGISLTAFLAPQYGGIVDKITQPFTFGEVALMLWLLFLGARPALLRRVGV